MTIQMNEITLQNLASKYHTYKMQTEKQRQSSMFAMQKYGISAPNYYSELASKYKQKKKTYR